MKIWLYIIILIVIFNNVCTSPAVKKKRGRIHQQRPSRRKSSFTSPRRGAASTRKSSASCSHVRTSCPANGKSGSTNNANSLDDCLKICHSKPGCQATVVKSTSAVTRKVTCYFYQRTVPRGGLVCYKPTRCPNSRRPGSTSGTGRGYANTGGASGRRPPTKPRTQPRPKPKPKPRSKPRPKPRPRPKVPKYKPGVVKSNRNTHPWLGRLMSTDTCSVILIPSEKSKIQSDIALTAAHCISKGEYIYVIFGGKRHKVAHVEVNPSYNRLNFHEADLAVIKLSPPVKYNNDLLPIALTEYSSWPSQPNNCKLSGWNIFRRTGYSTKSSVPQEARMIMQRASYCKRAWDDPSSDTYYDTSSMICAKHEKGQGSSCWGDSGGPLSCYENGKHVLYGIISFGERDDRCWQNGLPVVAANVYRLRNWILGTSRRLTGLR